MEDETALTRAGRDHWHHFRLGADAVHRCHWCAVTLEQFRAQERRNDVVRQEKAQEASQTLLMPKGTKVHRLYDKLRRQGRSKASAARIAQSQTGLALATGKPPTTHVTDHWTRKKRRR